MTTPEPRDPEIDLRRFLDLSGSLLVVADFDTTLRWLSPSYARILGFEPSQIIGAPFTDFIHPKDREEVVEQTRRLLAGDAVGQVEYRLRAADGSYRRVVTSALGVPEERLVYAVTQDVTELREVESLFESAFANARLSMLVASVDPAEMGRLTAANPAASRFTGYSEDELLARDFQSLMHPDDLASVLEELGALIRGERTSFELEKRYVHAEGHVVWGRMHVALIRDAADRPVYGVAQVQDISDRKQAEEEVAAAGRRFEQLFEDAPIGMALQDGDGRYLHVNRAFCELFGRSSDELLEMRLQELVHPADLDRDEELRAEMLRGETTVVQREKRFRRADGTWLEADVSISCINGTDERKRFIVQLQDVTDRRRLERDVARSRERLQALIDGMPSVVFVKDLEGRYELVNRALAEETGLLPEELVGRFDRDLFPPEVVERFARSEREARESDVPVAHEETLPLESGMRTFLTHSFALRDESGEADAVAGTAIDITERIKADEERRQLEARAQETQRLETVGKLAGGVAHDFNNLLSVILNGAALAAETLPEGSQARSDLDEIRSAAERAADLTHQLVQFSRQEMVEPRVLDANAIVLRAQRLLERTIGEDVELRTDIAQDVPNIEIDPGQLERVLVNLAVNARDAMPDGGTLQIVTDAVEIGGASFARLTVCDDGHGMSEETATRVFEPFFTTKPSGEGAGLGLATVYGIVKQAHGVIEIESGVGEGTRMVMRFPAAAEAVPEAQEPPEPRERGQGETLLVVEDEDSVRRLAARLLRDGGYEVLEASEGSEALRALDGHSVDLLLTDVVMPEMSGRELAEKLRASRPHTPVLFMSGYTDDVMVRHGVAGDGLSFLPKPFTRDSLLRAVSNALARRPV